MDQPGRVPSDLSESAPEPAALLDALKVVSARLVNLNGGPGQGTEPVVALLIDVAIHTARAGGIGPDEFIDLVKDAIDASLDDGEGVLS
jgi:hypothetical protein